MANSIAKLAINLTTDTSGMTRGFNEAKNKLAGFEQSIGGGMLGKFATKANIAAVAVAGIGAAVGGASWATRLAADTQKLETSFTTMTGSAEKAKAMMSDIQAFAAATPFETNELAAASKSLMAFGVAQNQIIPSMRMLGDMSSGLNIPLGELASLYGKARVQGRMFAEDMNQFQGRGIPIVQQLAKNFGVGEEKIRGMVEAGQVGFPQMHAALFELTKQGSMFGGAMEAQSKTFWGQWSTLTDNLKIAFGGIGKNFIGILTEMLSTINTALDGWNKFWGNTPKNAGKFAALDMKLVAEGMKPAELAKEVDKVAEAAERLTEKLKQNGASLTQSLRTPFERIRDDLLQARELWNTGNISGETWSRAMAKAREDLNAQAKSADDIANSLRQQNAPVAAMQFGTQQAISAMNTAAREQRVRDESQRIVAQKIDKTNELLARILREGGDDGVTVNEVNL